MKMSILSCLFVFYISYINAQINTNSTTIENLTKEELLQNPDVLWVGEFYSIFLLDEFEDKRLRDTQYLNNIGIKNNSSIKLVPIKNMETKHYFFNSIEDYYLANIFCNISYVDSMVAYKDAACTQKLFKLELNEAIVRQDTLYHIEPKNFDDTLLILYRLIQPIDITKYKVKHLVYYDQKTNTIGFIMESIAPILNIYDDNGNFKEQIPLFWLKIENDYVHKNLSNPDISWARRTIRTFDWKDATILKSTKNLESCLELYLEKIAANAKNEKIHSYNFIFQLFYIDEIENINKDIDERFMYNSTTAETTTIIDTIIIKGKDIEQFKLMQEWYWDYKQQKMMLSNLFFCPIYTLYDSKNNFLYNQHMFWRAIK